MVSHELVRWATTILSDLVELDLGGILQFWDPNQHFGKRKTENLDQTLHTDTAKTIRPAASPWVSSNYVCRVLKGLGEPIWKSFDFAPEYVEYTSE